MSVSKANRFIRKAKANGWEVRYQILSKKNQAIRVTATRAAEKIVIEWANNQLAYSPEYHLHEMQLKIHSRLDAERKLEQVKPDLDQYHRWQRKGRRNAMRKAAAVGQQAISNSEQNGEEEANLELVVSLPFSIDEDSDSTILKCIRGNTLIYRNSISGTVESVWVPHKAGDRVFNYDTNNVFFLAENEHGRAWLSFMDANGCFRAVHLDRLIGVV